MKEKKPIRSWTNDSYKNDASTFLLLLLAADSAFIFMHFLFVTHVQDNSLLSLGKDHGYPEIFQYIKEFWVVVLLLIILTKTRVIGHGIWALLFIYLLLDDALEIHETLGGYIATRLDFTPSLGLRAQDFGELVVSAMAAAFFLAALILPYMRGADPFKQVTRHLVLLVLALAFFGVFVDMLHIVFNQWKYIDALLAVVEDGGEMIVMSLIAWYVYLLNILDGTVGVMLRTPRIALLL